ncbi:MAG: macro domain-containing protein [Verrucomicrobiota bacterium]
MSSIIYLNGDATRPQASGAAMIVHVCNDVGGWGAGFVLAVSKRWPEPERRYRSWKRNQGPARNPEDPTFALGEVQFVEVEGDIVVANLIGQHGTRRGAGGTPPIRYDAVTEGLQKVAARASSLGASIHMPRIGCGLAGGSWDQMEPIIQKCLTEPGLKVFVYDFLI